MKNLTFAAALVATLALATTAFAQPADPGDLGVYFDPTATVVGGPSGGVPLPNSGTLAPFTPFDIYVISTDVPAGQEAYEFSIDIDARVTPTVETFFPAGSSDFGVDAGNFKNYLVGTGATCYGDGSTEVLVQWQGLLFAPADDVLFCLGAASPSSFVPARPGYLACNSPGDLRPYGSAYDGCAVGNMLNTAIPVSTEESTWGAVKARF